MASPGLRADWPCSSLFLLRFVILSLDSRGFGLARLLVGLLEVFLKVLVEPLGNHFGVATFQPVVLNFLVEKFLALFGISGDLGFVAAIFAAGFLLSLVWFTTVLALTEARKLLSALSVAIFMAFRLGLLAQLGQTDVLLYTLAVLLALIILTASFAAITLLCRSIAVILEVSTSSIAQS